MAKNSRRRMRCSVRSETDWTATRWWHHILPAARRERADRSRPRDRDAMLVMPGLVPGIHVLPSGMVDNFSRRPNRATNPALELSIDPERLPVGEGEDLHHDHAGDPHRRVDPVIGIEQTGPCQAACLAAVADGIDIDHVSKPPSQPNARKKIHVVR